MKLIFSRRPKSSVHRWEGITNSPGRGMAEGPVCPELGSWERGSRIKTEQEATCRRCMTRRLLLVLADPNRNLVLPEQPEFLQLDSRGFVERKPELKSGAQRKEFLFRNSKTSGNLVGNP